MKFELTLTTILIFLVPGSLLLFGLPGGLVSVIDQWQIIKKPANAIEGGVLITVIFIAGSIIDALRRITVQIIVKWIAVLFGSRIPENYVKHINKESLDIFLTINQEVYGYFRFNENLTLALAVISVCQCWYYWIGWSSSVAIFLTFIWLYISVRSQIDLNRTLHGFVAANCHASGAQASASAQL